MICNNCKNEIDDKFEFCPYCGCSTKKVLTCPNCGTICSPDDIYCTNCGTNIASGEQTSYKLEDRKITNEILWNEVGNLLKNNEWEKVNNYCDKMLELDSNNAYAYLGRLLSSFKCESIIDFKDELDNASNNDDYINLKKYADKNLLEQIKYLEECKKNEQIEQIYSNAINIMNSAYTENSYKEAASIFKSIKEYKDSSYLFDQCNDKAEICRREEIYNIAKFKMNDHEIESYEEAINGFEEICDYKDSNELIIECSREIDNIKSRKNTRKKILKIFITIIVITISFYFLFTKIILVKYKYNKAMDLIIEEKYTEGYEILAEIGQSSLITKNIYERAINYYNEQDYENAYILLNDIEYEDSVKLRDKSLCFLIDELLNDEDYENAISKYCLIKEKKEYVNIYSTKFIPYFQSLISENNLLEFIVTIDKLEMDNVEPIVSIADVVYKELADQSLDNKNYDDAIKYYKKISTCITDDEFFTEIDYCKAKDLYDEKKYLEAVDSFSEIIEYKDSKSKMYKSMYAYIIDSNNKKDSKVIEFLTELRDLGYSNCVDLYNEYYSWKASIECKYEHTDYLTTCVVTISGGLPGQSISGYSVKIESLDYGWETGGVILLDHKGQEKNMTDGYSFEYRHSGLPGGRTIITFYDDDDNYLGQGEVYITDNFCGPQYE